MGPAEQEPPPVDIARFALVVYTLGPIGWAIEAAITAWVLGMLARVRPSLVFGEPSGPPGGPGS